MAGEPYELFFSLTAEQRGLRGQADLRAGGRLRMAGERGADGALSLRLVEAVEDPWKLYWSDPLGPLGAEVKHAAVIALPAMTWEALEAAQLESRRAGAERYETWRAETGNRAPFDGAFAFVVVGPAAGRLLVTIDSRGRVTEVRNALTDRWLPGPFDAFVGAAGEPRGYWFWNDGESRPFPWEPHTYHALAEAVRLLAWPSAAAGSVRWPNPAAAASGVLGRLAPRLPKPAVDRSELAVEFTASVAADGALELAGRGDDPARELNVERLTRRCPGVGVIADRLRIRQRRGRGHLRLEVGYRPQFTLECQKNAPGGN